VLIKSAQVVGRHCCASCAGAVQSTLDLCSPFCCAQGVKTSLGSWGTTPRTALLCLSEWPQTKPLPPSLVRASGPCLRLELAGPFMHRISFREPDLSPAIGVTSCSINYSILRRIMQLCAVGNVHTCALVSADRQPFCWYAYPLLVVFAPVAWLS